MSKLDFWGINNNFPVLAENATTTKDAINYVLFFGLGNNLRYSGMGALSSLWLTANVMIRKDFLASCLFVSKYDEWWVDQDPCCPTCRPLVLIVGPLDSSSFVVGVRKLICKGIITVTSTSLM